MALLGRAVSRPGIDPRTWISVAYVASEVVVDMETEDGSAGIFVDVVLLPSNMEATARLGASYAGNGFGIYTPLHVDDEVLVVAPSGDPNNGLVITQRLWSASDPPPQEVADNPTDVVMVVEADKNVRLKLQGEGSVFLDIAEGGGLTLNVVGDGNVQLNVDGGKVFLGESSGTEPAAKATSLKSYLTDLATALAAHTHATAASGPPVAPVFPTPYPSLPELAASKVEVK
jgi:hypothetical protein